jgi:hypothetical protein
MLRASRRDAIAFVGFFLLSCIVLTETLLRCQYHNVHHKMALSYHDRELCTMRAPDPRLIYAYVSNRCGANAQV